MKRFPMHSASRTPRRQWTLTVGLTLTVLALGTSLRGQSESVPPEAEAPGPAPTTVPETPDEEELARQVLASLADASQRLQDGEIDESTIALQQTASDRIDALLQKLRDNAQPSSQQGEPDPSDSQSASAGGQTSSSQPSTSRNAAQANEQAQDGAAGEEAELIRRRHLAQAVWGHLPPKLQEELQRSFSERFAPKYDAMIRRYYEALAREPAPQP